MPDLKQQPETGEITIISSDGTSGTITITAVVDADTLIIFSSSNADELGRNRRHEFTLELTSTTQLTWTRDQSGSARTVTLRYWVIEIDSLGSSGIQRGRMNSHSSNDNDQTISTVGNTDRAVTIFSRNQGVNFSNGGGQRRSTLTSVTNLRIRFDETPNNGEDTAYQVIEFNDADVDVQRGTIDITGSGESNTGTITSVDTGKSWINHPGHSGPDKTAGTEFKPTNTMQLTDDTTLSVTRGNQGSNSSTDVMAYEVVEFLDDTIVEHGQIQLAISTASATSSTFSPKPDENKTVPMTNSSPQNHGESDASTEITPEDYYCRHTLDITAGEVDSVTITRSGSASLMDYDYNVVEFSAAAGATLIERPLVHSQAVSRAANY